MIVENSYDIKQQLKKIAELLIKKGDLLENTGLLHGKMGIAVFLFHYARYTDNESFEDYAVGLIQKTQAGIHVNSSSDYANGLAGIGVGIEYLSQNGFLDIDTDEILVNIDSRIRRDVMYVKHDNNSIVDGLSGLGQYLLYRVNRRAVGTNDFCLQLNCELMLHVVNILENERLPQIDEIPDVLSFLCRLYYRNICNPKIERYLDRLLKSFLFDEIPEKKISYWAFSLLSLSTIRNQTTEITRKIIYKSLQMFESTKDKKPLEEKIYYLQWLLQCKRLIKKAGICTDLFFEIEASINVILMRKYQEFLFENEKLSLLGYAGLGLALMTASGSCDDAWLDLLI